MIIFTGTGRSGTGLYSKLFDTFHEYNVHQLIKKHFPPPYERLRSDPFADFQSRLKIMRDHLRDIKIATFRDSSNPYVSFLDALYEIDPNIKIVFGVRDGRDFAVSGITRGYYNEKKYSGYSMTPEEDDPYFSRWPNMTPLERMAWMWDYRNRKALKRLEFIPKENQMIIRLEDLTQDNEKSIYWIEELETFLSLKANREELKKRYNASAKYSYPPKEAWNEEMKTRFDRIADDLMRKFGYYTSKRRKEDLPMNNTNEAMIRGEELFRAGNMNEAREIFEQVVQDDPLNYEAMNNLGTVLYMLSQIDDAERWFHKTLSIKEDDPDALSNLADLYVNQKRWTEAASILERYLRDDASNTNRLNQLALVYLESGKPDRAIPFLQKSLEIQSDQDNIRNALDAIALKPNEKTGPVIRPVGKSSPLVSVGLPGLKYKTPLIFSLKAT